MGLSKNVKSLFIDKEALDTLAMVKEGILSPVTKLMNSIEAKEVEEKSLYKGKFFPFPFILAPSGNTNEKVLTSLKKGQKVNLVEGRVKCGELIVEDVFEIDRLKRVEQIFATTDLNHPGVKNILNRLGKYAVSGEYTVDTTFVKDVKSKIQNLKDLIGAKKISAIMMAAKPLHRGHERMIRIALDKNDMIVLFLLKPYKKDKFSYELREKALKYYVDNFLPKNRVLIVPFENTYIFAGYNSVFLDALAAKNFGCSSINIGENHSGIGIFYDKYDTNTISNLFKDENFDIEVVNEYVYCNICKTLVSTKTCPHGSHHHIAYKSEFIAELMIQGLLPPSILVRKEISAIFLSTLFKNRWKNLIAKYPDFFPSNGLLEEMDDKKFYLKIIDLHQTVSLT